MNVTIHITSEHMEAARYAINLMFVGFMAAGAYASWGRPKYRTMSLACICWGLLLVPPTHWEDILGWPLQLATVAAYGAVVWSVNRIASKVNFFSACMATGAVLCVGLDSWVEPLLAAVFVIVCALHGGIIRIKEEKQ